MVDFQFTEEPHEYRLDNVVIPSPTKVLVDLRIMNLDFVSDDDLRFGTAVHDTTKFYDRGTLDDSILNPLLAIRLAAWKRFLHDTKFVIDTSNIEIPKYSKKYKYGFTTDRTGWFEVKRTILRTVLDIKTATVPNHLANKLQLAGYQLAENEYIEGKDKIKRRIAVHLLPNGSYKINEYKDKSDFNTWLSCLNVFKIKMKHNIV